MDEILTLEQWYELKGRISQQYPELTDADLQYHESTEKDILAMVKCSLNKTKEIMQVMMGRPNRLSPLKNYWRYSRRHRNLQEAD